MVDATLQAGTEGRRLALASGRAQLARAGVVLDIVAVIGGYVTAEAINAFRLSALGTPHVPFAPDWAVAVFIVMVVSAFHASGLYEPEAFVSRPLHLWTLLKATLVALVLSALTLFLIKAQPFSASWTVLLTTFGLFVVYAVVLRLGVLDRSLGFWMWENKPVTILVGDSETTRKLEERLAALRGFEWVERISPNDVERGAEKTLSAVLERCWRMDAQACSVFVDARGLAPRQVYETTTAAQAQGAEVYLVSGLLEALQGHRLLGKLFGVPAIRLRGSIETAKPYALKRFLDIVGSGILLLLSAPVLAVLGIAIRLTSPGPVFYTQTRIGRHGVPFQFLKLRSMVMNGDECIHEDYVRAFMNGTAEAVATGNGGETIFKKVDDPRITPVGRFVRKYSLDEIPQFWNVFRGDMSLVGPRPPLPYEVSEYDDWDSLRLSVPAGITGLWQVEGRSRVSFDEMVLQDLMYAQNMRLLVDVALCLRTLPAMLLGGGGG